MNDISYFRKAYSPPRVAPIPRVVLNTPILQSNTKGENSTDLLV